MQSRSRLTDYWPAVAWATPTGRTTSGLDPAFELMVVLPNMGGALNRNPRFHEVTTAVAAVGIGAYITLLYAHLA